jgi:histidyl-tRNA synthetase
MKESIETQPLRGMRDFLPKDWIFRKKLMQVWSETAEQNGFVRYETPIVESLSLLERKAGEEISDQIYNFEDKSGRAIALRPEITPSMVRIVSGNREAFPSTGKVYSIGQCFRYERASLGRKREHFQWNIDIVGEDSVICEAYLIQTAVGAMKRLGFEKGEFRVRVNNRVLVADFLNTLQIVGENALAVMGVMDKKEKVPAEVFAEMLKEIGINDAQIERINAFMSSKDLQTIETFVPDDCQGLKDLKQFWNYCQALNLTDYVVIDTAIVRGLAYYTGIVFECFDTKGKFRAIFGGGRYDHLFERLTGKACSAVGLGFGDVVVEELYKDKFGIPEKAEGVDVALGGFGELAHATLLKLVADLDETNYTLDYDFKSSAPGKFLGRADKRGAKVAVYIGENELNQGVVMVKNLSNKEQVFVPVSDVVSTVRQILG